MGRGGAGRGSQYIFPNLEKMYQLRIINPRPVHFSKFSGGAGRGGAERGRQSRWVWDLGSQDALGRNHHSHCICSVVRLDMLWTNLDEILCTHLSQMAYISTVKLEGAILKIMLYIGKKRPAHYILSVLPASVTMIKHSFGSRLPWLS